MKKFFEEFKTFAIRGNVIDMAVGIVIGSAFTSIVTSLVNDIIMPFVAMATGNVQFSDLCIVLKQTEDSAITWNYGNFIQTVLNFIIVAWCMFLIVRAMNAAKKKEEPAPEPVKEPEDSPELKTLKEIRDLLSEKK